MRTERVLILVNNVALKLICSKKAQKLLQSGKGIILLLDLGSVLLFKHLHCTIISSLSFTCTHQTFLTQYSTYREIMTLRKGLCYISEEIKSNNNLTNFDFTLSEGLRYVSQKIVKGFTFFSAFVYF